MTRAYTELERRFERHYLFRSSADLLDWDAATTMPDGAVDLRGAQLATLRGAAQDALSAPDMEDLLGRADAEPPDSAWERANLRAMRHAWTHAASVPTALCEAKTRAQTACEMRWRTARKENDFAGLLPSFEELLRIVREVAIAKAERLGTSPYDALFDEFEPGGRSERADALFALLGKELPPLVERALDAQARRPAVTAAKGPFPTAKQEILARKLAERLGFDFARGRMDTSTHPFCGGAAEDVRITTRYDEDDFLSGAFSVLHETGHALYELGLPRQWVRQPVGQAVGMAVHESQSLLVEMQACRSRAFYTFFAPFASSVLGVPLDPAALHAQTTLVERSLIRVDADEMTYPLHVVLRYRLERALVEGSLVLRDLPGAWRDGTKELLGITPPDDRVGCLQDIHWPSGAFGYFPTYTMGAASAAQLFAKAKIDVPDLESALERGDFGPLREWLRPNVHEQGSFHFGTDALLTHATGRALDPEALLAHLRARYLAA